LDDYFIFFNIADAYRKNNDKLKTMASIKDLKKFINSIIDEINYDIELYVGLNLDKNHTEAQELYGDVYTTRIKYLQKVNEKGLNKKDYKKIEEDFLYEVDELNKRLCKIIGNS